MAIRITNRSFKNALTNGFNFALNPSVFTNFLRANAGELVQILHDVEVFWGSQTDDSSPFVFKATQKRIQFGGFGFGDFLADEFAIGDTIRVTGSNFNDGDYTIIGLGSEFIDVAETLVNETSSLAIIQGVTPLTDLRFRYNFVENNEPNRFDSNFNATQENLYYATGINTSTDVNLIPQGNIKNWQAGTLNVLKIDTGDDTLQKFRITHNTFLLPYYLDGYQQNLRDKIPPGDFFAGQKSLKYIFDVQFSTDFSNPNAGQGGLGDGGSGNTGWFEENFTSPGTKKYNLVSIGYQDIATMQAVAGLQVDRSTRVSITINSAEGTFTTDSRFQIAHSYLPESDDYTNGDAAFRTIEENFLLDGLINVVGAAAASSDIVTNVTAVLNSASQITITADIAFSSLQQALISSQKEYLIAVGVGSHSANYTDRVNLLIDYSNYEKNDDVPDLFDIENFKIYQHNENEAEAADGHTSIGIYVEDKVYANFDFWLDVSKGAVIDDMNFRLMAFNVAANKSFELQSFPVNLLGTNTAIGQQINVNTTRLFLLVNGSKFNRVKITKGSLVGDKQYYSVNFAFVFNWEDYKELLAADSVFFDGTQPFNGLNLLSSNYSAKQDYNIRLFIDSNINNSEVVTAYRSISPVIDVYEYDEDQFVTPNYTTVKQFFNQAGANIGLNALKNEKTRVKYTFNKINGDIDDSPYGIFRLEEYRNGGLQSIHELSSIEPTADNNPLKPLAGSSGTKVTLVTAKQLTIECEIDNTLIEEGKRYHVSGRIGYYPISSIVGCGVDGKETEEGECKFTEDGILKIIE
jgi:hypothetical protein